jgi:hypothetical protein
MPDALLWTSTSVNAYNKQKQNKNFMEQQQRLIKDERKIGKIGPRQTFQYFHQIF